MHNAVFKRIKMKVALTHTHTHTWLKSKGSDYSHWTSYCVLMYLHACVLLRCLKTDRRTKNCFRQCTICTQCSAVHDEAKLNDWRKKNLITDTLTHKFANIVWVRVHPQYAHTHVQIGKLLEARSLEQNAAAAAATAMATHLLSTTLTRYVASRHVHFAA